jgi:hypothetical protein
MSKLVTQKVHDSKATPGKYPILEGVIPTIDPGRCQMKSGAVAFNDETAIAVDHDEVGHDTFDRHLRVDL